MAGPQRYTVDHSTFGKQPRAGRVTAPGSHFAASGSIRKLGADPDVGSLSLCVLHDYPPLGSTDDRCAFRGSPKFTDRVSRFCRYAGRDIAIPDPSTYLHTLSQTSSVSKQSLSRHKSAPSFGFGSSKGQGQYVNSQVNVVYSWYKGTGFVVWSRA